jgi:hypothetical protein
MMPSIDEAKLKFAFWRERFKGYQETSLRNGGRLKRSDMWYREYCRDPYLTLASEEYLSSRFTDQFHNNMRLTAKGQIAPRVDFSQDDGLFGPLFAHIWLEYQYRGGTPENVITEANKQIEKYFENGRPTGVNLFREYPETIENSIVKFGKRGHLERMLSRGEVRISPADYYSSGSLLKAMTDLETQREFHIPSFREFLDGQTHVKFKNLDAKIEDGFIRFVVECPKYLLWCACLDIDRRMPDDFGADAALIIRQPKEFIDRITAKVRKSWPSAKIWSGPVKYYDPCSFFDLKKRPETIKHFSFAYQREWRFCVFPKEHEIPESPVLIELGELSDIAELVTLA